MTPSPSERRAHGIAVRQARLARVSAIRRRAVASALALFVATWLLITVLLITGHDPALARTQSRSTGSRSTATTTTASNGGATATTTSSQSAASSSAGSASSSSPSSLTSSQS